MQPQLASVGVRRSLARADFRRLFGIRLSSQWADGVFQASLAGAVLFNPQRAADPGDVAAAFAVLLLPYSLIGPFAGVLLDRWSRQRVLLLSNLTRCGLVVVVGLLIAGGFGGVGFYAAALAVISVNRFFLSALSTSLPHVTDATALVGANALTTTVGTVATVVGGGCAVGLGAALGTGDRGYAWVAVGSAVGYAGSALLARGFRRQQLGPDAAERGARPSAGHVLAGLLAGVRHIGRSSAALPALGAMAAHRFLFGLATVITVLLYRNYFTGDGWFRAGLTGLTQVVAAGAIGAVLAAVITPGAVHAVGKRRWIVGALGAAALTQLIFGAPFLMPTVLAAAACLGFAGQAVKICVETVLQETIEDAYRGRVFSVYDMAFNAAFVAAAVLAAFVLPITGRSYAVLGVVVVGYAATAAAYAVSSRGS